MDPVLLSIIGHAYVATAEEMGVNLYRSAHSTIVREVRDMATALFDADGNTVAMANWIPMLLNAMEPAAQALRRHYDFRQLRPDEAMLTNDPFDGGQHVNDILLFTPVFVDGEVIGLSCANVHHLDLGGGAPANNAQATEVYQEGIVFPPMKITLGADWEDSPFGKFLRANIRVPEKTIPDFNAQIAACRTGEARVAALCRKYGKDTIVAFQQEIQRYSERIIRSAIETIPDGDYRGEAHMEDDGTGADGPFTIRVTVRIRGSDMILDFTGTDAQARGFINIPLASTYATCRTTIMSILQAGHLLVNAGAFRPIQVVAPPGTLVNPARPAATRARTSTCYKIFDAVNYALAPVLPDKVIAPGFDCQTGISMALRHEGRYRVLSEVLGAGVGALHNQDGADGMIMHLTNGMNTPVESVEIEFPFLEILRYGLVADSGGPGQCRGGLGMERRYRILADGVNFGLHSDRHRHAAPGLFGGQAGLPGACFVERADEVITLGSKVSATLRAGDLLTVRSGGGAGYGPVEQRDPRLVERDLREDRISPQHAARVYHEAQRSRVPA
ncbi:MAG: hydantoinase B/oxoprolinase family protein [Armatimonadota bacterium]|nr:hydantoinase B/oxoprolinase family protein [Armatimonadota bacterium]